MGAIKLAEVIELKTSQKIDDETKYKDGDDGNGYDCIHPDWAFIKEDGFFQKGQSMIWCPSCGGLYVEVSNKKLQYYHSVFYKEAEVSTITINDKLFIQFCPDINFEE